ARGEARVELLELRDLVVAELEIARRVEEIADGRARRGRERWQVTRLGVSRFGVVMAARGSKGRRQGQDEQESHRGDLATNRRALPPKSRASARNLTSTPRACRGLPERGGIATECVHRGVALGLLGGKSPRRLFFL